MSAYYNEHDPKAAATLRELIKRGIIADGEVDERSIEDVLPNELIRFTQCHFFAGFGVWSYALRNAGWPDDRPVWTGSCPCQPFSTAGKGEGFTYERHLWPAFFHLIQQRKPDVVFGEQVESTDGRTWLDLVQTDLEASGYAFGPVGLCAAGFGAPHIRPRLYFVADAGSVKSGWLSSVQRQEISEVGSGCESGELGNATFNGSGAFNGQSGQGGRLQEPIGRSGFSGNLGNTDDARSQGRRLFRAGSERVSPDQCTAGAASPTNGFWRNAEWLYCRDEKYRAVEPGTFPLADGAAERVGRLRGYGNAIVAPVAEEFIRAFIETKKES